MTSLRRKCEVPVMFFISKMAFNRAVDKAACEVQCRETLEMKVWDQGNKLVELEDRVGRLERVIIREKRKAVKK